MHDNATDFTVLSIGFEQVLISVEAAGLNTVDRE